MLLRRPTNSHQLLLLFDRNTKLRKTFFKFPIVNSWLTTLTRNTTEHIFQDILRFVKFLSKIFNLV